MSFSSLINENPYNLPEAHEVNELAQFNQVTEVKVDFQKNEVRIFTTHLVVYKDATRREAAVLVPHEIRFNLFKDETVMQVRFFPLGRRGHHPDHHSYKHPHVAGTGMMCLGHFKDAILTEGLSWQERVFYALQALETYTAREDLGIFEETAKWIKVEQRTKFRKRLKRRLTKADILKEYV